MYRSIRAAIALFFLLTSTAVSLSGCSQPEAAALSPEEEKILIQHLKKGTEALTEMLAAIDRYRCGDYQVALRKYKENMEKAEKAAGGRYFFSEDFYDSSRGIEASLCGETSI